jgi:hypothetical protein
MSRKRWSGEKMLIQQQTKVKVFGAAMILAVMFVCSIAAFAAVAVSTNSLQFSNQTVGVKSAPMSVTISNTGRQIIIIESASVSTAQFSYSGPAFPITLREGQSFTGSVTFTPAAAKVYTGTLAFRSFGFDGSSISVKLSGTGTSPVVSETLTASSSALSFSAQVGAAAPAAQSLTIGDSPASAEAFTAAADQTWISLSAASGTTSSAIQIGANVSGLAAGSYSGHVIVAASGVTNSPMSIPVTLVITAAQSSTLTATPSAMSFSAVAGGAAPASQSLTIGENPAGAATFTVTADQSWMTLSAASGTTSSTIQVGANISGLAAGNYTGHVVTTTAGVTNSPMSVTVTLAVAAAQTNLLTVNPTSVAFGNINLANNNTKSVTLTNSGTGSVTISQINVVGVGISVNGVATPMTLTAGQTTVLSIVYSPTVLGVVAGSISVVSNATNSPAVILATGTGVQPQLAANPTSLSFGNVAVGATASQTVTLTNNGSAAVTVSQGAFSGAGFDGSGPALPITLSAGASASFSIQFAPTVAGAVTGSITATSNAPNSPTMIALSGTGTSSAPVAHSVSLSWVASTSTAVVGYNIYRGSVSGGPYTVLNSTPNAGLTYTDMTVTAGQTYYYVVTAVDGSGNESVVSNQVAVTIPTP